MKFTTMLLCEHATVNEVGLVNMLNGGANRIARADFPAAFGLTLVAIIELSPDYESGALIPVTFTLGPIDDSEERFGRAEGEVFSHLIEGSDKRVANATVVIDLSPLPLTKPGVCRVTGSIAGSDPQSIFLEVVQTESLTPPPKPVLPTEQSA